MLSKLLYCVTRKSQNVYGSRKTIAAALIAVTFAAYLSFQAAPVLAHHSVAMFEETTELVLHGVVRTMEWANPHVWIRLNVADSQGDVVEWGIEAGNPLGLQRRGWSRTTFKPDDNVTISVHPAKNGTPFGNFVRATLANGTALGEPESD